MGKNQEYTNEFKIEVLDACDKVGNVSTVAEQYDISRGTVYAWRRKEDKIREAVAKDEVMDKLVKDRGLNVEVASKLDTFQDLLSEIGSEEERRQKLANQVEYSLMKVVTLLEEHPDLDKVHPKDLARIMTDLRETKAKLRREPDVVIEYRNAMMETILSVLRGKFLTDDELREFVRRVEAVEADFEIVE